MGPISPEGARRGGRKAESGPLQTDLTAHLRGIIKHEIISQAASEKSRPERGHERRVRRRAA